jgi:hypothetical protein
MLSESERRLARIAVQNRYLTGTQLYVCVESKRTSPIPLEKIFVDHGYLTAEEVSELVRLTEQVAAAAPTFGELLKERGLASDSQILDASALKARLATQNIHRYLGEILVERRVISPERVRELLAQQGKECVECGGCGYRFNAVHGQGYACPECGRTIEKAVDPSDPPLALTLREEIGSGPTGTVHRAFHEALHQEVALKVLNAGRTPGDLARRAATTLHPNIARTLAFDQWNGQPCIVSEFVEGIPLYDHVVGNLRLAPEDAIPLLKQVAAALGAAHARRILHGNLKARNVIVTESRELKVTDFGLAPERNESISADLHLYLAPERIVDGPSVAADLYACGVLWYFMLSGGQPFAAPTAPEIRRRHLESRPTPLSARVPGLPSGVDAVFTKLTFRDPGLRYRTAAALLDDLDRLENGDIPLAERELGKPRS